MYQRLLLSRCCWLDRRCWPAFFRHAEQRRSIRWKHYVRNKHYGESGMKSFGLFLRKLEIFFRGERFHRELEEEMAFHRDEAAKELRGDGVTSDDARHTANRQFGNDARLRDESRETVGFWFEGMLQDFRFALRQLRKNLGFAITAISILTLGI